MTLDEAIKHAEAAAHQEELKSGFDTNYECYKMSDSERMEYKKNAEEHRQIAEWLKELKDYRERIPSYEAGYNDAKREIALSGEYERAYERGKADAQPKMGRWIKTPKAVMGEGYMWYCDKCEHLVYQDSSRPYPSEKFCPNCGQPKMQEVNE